MAACLALLTLALALVYVGPSEVEASLSDGDVHENGTWKYRVVEAGRMYDDSDLGDWTRIWVVPGSSTVVPEGAFEGCTKVRYVYFDQGVTGIGKRAFADMEGLYNVYGGDVETIGQEAFAGSSVEVATFGTGTICADDCLSDAVRLVFGLTPSEIIAQLELLTPRYTQTAAYGHFGKPELPWERTDQAKILRATVI